VERPQMDGSIVNLMNKFSTGAIRLGLFKPTLVRAALLRTRFERDGDKPTTTLTWLGTWYHTLPFRLFFLRLPQSIATVTPRFSRWLTAHVFTGVENHSSMFEQKLQLCSDEGWQSLVARRGNKVGRCRFDALFRCSS
jgi:hypothetical protein